VRRFRQGKKEMKIRFIVAFAAVFSAIGFFLSSNFQKTESAGFINSRCAVSSFRSAYRQSKAVFVGEVVGEEKDGDNKIIKFEIKQSWKGANAKNLEINVYETTRYQAFFKNGEKYLIYATAGEDGKLYVGKCSRSDNAANAAEDLRKLGKGKIPR
jgi:Skp family chaperone for outer membrane proteins